MGDGAWCGRLDVGSWKLEVGAGWCEEVPCGAGSIHINSLVLFSFAHFLMYHVSYFLFQAAE
jgi:hypothetical protein